MMRPALALGPGVGATTCHATVATAWHGIRAKAGAKELATLGMLSTHSQLGAALARRSAKLLPALTAQGARA